MTDFGVVPARTGDTFAAPGAAGTWTTAPVKGVAWGGTRMGVRMPGSDDTYTNPVDRLGAWTTAPVKGIFWNGRVMFVPLGAWEHPPAADNTGGGGGGGGDLGTQYPTTGQIFPLGDEYIETTTSGMNPFVAAMIFGDEDE